MGHPRMQFEAVHMIHMTENALQQAHREQYHIFVEHNRNTKSQDDACPHHEDGQCRALDPGSKSSRAEVRARSPRNIYMRRKKMAHLFMPVAVSAATNIGPLTPHIELLMQLHGPRRNNIHTPYEVKDIPKQVRIVRIQLSSQVVDASDVFVLRSPSPVLPPLSAPQLFRIPRPLSIPPPSLTHLNNTSTDV